MPDFNEAQNSIFDINDPMRVEPVTLEGERAHLVPLALEHHFALWEIADDEELWRWNPEPVRSLAEMRAYVESALAAQAQGTALPFVIFDKASGSVAGTTRYGNIERQHRRVEIGWTWLGREFQRTRINTETKYLLLRHAFETLGCLRVELKTDSLNARSRAAVLRIGAIEEGTLRNHMLTSTGRIRHSVYFSLIRSEWAEAKVELERKLARH